MFPAGATKATEITVSCEVDGVALRFDTWTDLSALLALRLSARLSRPRRGCESGLCGACESLVDGVPVRLCQLPAAGLDGAQVVTGSA